MYEKGNVVNTPWQQRSYAFSWSIAAQKPLRKHAIATRTISLSNGLSYYTTIEHANGEENRNCHFLMHCMSLPKKKNQEKMHSTGLYPPCRQPGLLWHQKMMSVISWQRESSLSCPLDDVLSKYTPSVLCIDI